MREHAAAKEGTPRHRRARRGKRGHAEAKAKTSVGAATTEADLDAASLSSNVDAASLGFPRLLSGGFPVEGIVIAEQAIWRPHTYGRTVKARRRLANDPNQGRRWSRPGRRTLSAANSPAVVAACIDNRSLFGASGRLASAR